MLSFVTFGNMDELVSLSPEVSENISKSLNTRKSFGNINELLAYGLNLRDGYDENGVSGILLKRVTDRPKFMDHGYFSAVILAKHAVRCRVYSAQRPRQSGRAC